MTSIGSTVLEASFGSVHKSEVTAGNRSDVNQDGHHDLWFQRNTDVAWVSSNRRGVAFACLAFTADF